MISAGERDQIRRDAETLLTATCVIQTLTLTSDGAGGQNETWVDGDPVACRFAPIGVRGSGNAETAGRIDESTTHIFTLPFDVVITHDSRIVCEGRTWAVTALPERDSDTTFVRRAEVREVD